MPRRLVIPAALVTTTALVLGGCGGGGRTAARPTERAPSTTVAPATTAAPTTTLPPTTTTEPPPPPVGPVALAGCPPPPHRPGPPAPRWHPDVLVPESAMPPPADPAPWHSDTRAALGKGMWIWELPATEHGDVDAIVARAAGTGLRQLWVRVGDSRRGFYGADVLDPLVARAHQRGLRVIGWGFPYLYDPVGDARWTEQALAWRDALGNTLDGFSPDIELGTEGVALTERRAAVYLGAVRRAAGSRTVVATVYRPTDRLWRGAYPYATIAKYVDAFAPMVYWGCVEPGAAAYETIVRLAALRPVHLIGQAYDMGPEGGRPGAPSADEIRRFLDVARRGGALGASFWSWQHANATAWSVLGAFPWDKIPNHR